MGATMSKPKITVLPPADQDVFFQEQQFDKEIPGGSIGNRGQDPIKYTQSGPRFDIALREKNARNANVGLAKSKKRKLKTAEKELEGHENKDEILKILRSE